MSEKLSKQQFVQIATSIVGALALVLVAVGVLSDGAANQPTARGTTNFDTVSVDSLVVDSQYPLESATEGQTIFVGSGSITQTVPAHGLSTVTAAACDLSVAPSTGAGAPAFCVPLISGSTVTITLYQDDWTTAATSAAQASYIIVGSP